MPEQDASQTGTVLTAVVNRRHGEEVLSMMARIARPAYVWLSRAVLAAVVVQFFLAGLGVFVGPANFAIHRGFAFVIMLLMMAGLAACFAARVPWLTTGEWVLLNVLLHVQGGLVLLGGMGYRWVAAAHPVNGLLIFLISYRLVTSAGRLVTALPEARTLPAPGRPHVAAA